MTDPVTLSITAQQRDLLVQGLRFLRSSRRYEFRDPLNPTDARRDNDLREIVGLMTRLDPESAGSAKDG